MNLFKVIENYIENRKLKKESAKQNKKYGTKNHETFQQLLSIFTIMSFVALPKERRTKYL